MILFEGSCVLGTNCDKKNTSLYFEVPASVHSLKIEYDYTPKEPEESIAVEAIKAGLHQYGQHLSDKDPYHYLPAKNLVTLSLDSPSGYRGAAHRQDAKQVHQIGADAASPGFCAGPIEPGRWRLSLNGHCIMCPVTCNLKVTGEATQ